MVASASGYCLLCSGQCLRINFFLIRAIALPIEWRGAIVVVAQETNPLHIETLTVV